MTKSNTFSNTLLGGLFLVLAGCGGADELALTPETGASTQPDPMEVRRKATAALEQHIGDLALRLATGEEAAETRSMDVQAAWSVSLRELTRRMGKIETRLTQLPEKGADWQSEVKQIHDAVDVLESQLDAELQALARLR